MRGVRRYIMNPDKFKPSKNEEKRDTSFKGSGYLLRANKPDRL